MGRPPSGRLPGGQRRKVRYEMLTLLRQEMADHPETTAEFGCQISDPSLTRAAAA